MNRALLTAVIGTGKGNPLDPGEGRLRARFDPVTSDVQGTVELRGSLANTFDAVTSAITGTQSVPPAGETATFTIQPASWHTRPIAARQGTFGPTRSGLFWLIASGSIERYVWWSQEDAHGNQCGIDPGLYVAELDGVTGIEVALGPGNISATDVATATRTALDAAGIYTDIGGSSDQVAVTGAITAASCTVGGMFDPSTFGQFGARRTIPQFTSSPLNGRVAQFGIWSGGDVIVKSIGIYLADTTDDLRLAVYTGGTSGSLSGTVLEGETLIDGGGAIGWQWGAVPEPFVLSDGNFRLVAKSNGASIPGYITNANLTDCDFPDAGGGSTYPLEIYDTMSTDPAVAFPSTLNGEGVTTAGVYAMMAIEYIAADGTSGVFVTRIGIAEGVAATSLGSLSSLTAPDAGGADLFMGTPNPGLLGMELDAWGIAQGDTHSTQMRGFVACGGSIGDAETAVVIWQGQTTGSATNAWLEVAASGSIPSTGPLWWGVRNNAATVNLRFSLNANRENASPDANPADWTDASEYEIFRSVNGDGTGGNVHETDPAAAIADPIATDGGFTANNTNYPGAYLVISIPADEVAA